MYKLTVKKEANWEVANILIQDNLTINEDMESIRNLLIESAQKYDLININSQEELEVDLTFLQILISAHNNIKAKGKKLNVDIKLTKTSKKLVKVSGITILHN